MSGILKELKEINILAKERDCQSFLLGGAIRDKFLDRKTKDLDIVINKRVEEIARFFADKNKGNIVTLDDNRKIYRVITEKGVFDFAQMIGKNIEEDLKNRDFTINAIAISLQDLIELEIEDFSSWQDKMIDPCNGLDDLAASILRINNKKVFKDDPLRLWRTLRLKKQLDFTISRETKEQIKKDNFLATEPANERIKAELDQFFLCQDLAETVSFFEDNFELFSILIPEISTMKKTGENQHHQENAWQHCLQVLDMLERVLKEDKYHQLLEDYQLALIKIAALLHDMGKIKSRSVKNNKVHYYGHEIKSAEMLSLILKRLKFSRKERIFILTIVENHMRPMLLFLAENLTDKGRYRFFRKLGDLAPVVLIHSLADKLAAMEYNQKQEEMDKYQKFIDQMLAMYGDYKLKTANLILSGKEIIEKFSLKEGPLIGKLLDKLDEAQALEEVNDKRSAYDYLSSYLNGLKRY